MGGVGMVVAQIRYGTVQRSWPKIAFVVHLINRKTPDSHLVLALMKNYIVSAMAVSETLPVNSTIRHGNTRGRGRDNKKNCKTINVIHHNSA